MGNSLQTVRSLGQECIKFKDGDENAEFIWNNNNAPKLDLRNVRLLDLVAFIENKPTELEETQHVLKYRTPQFRAKAKVLLPALKKDQEIQVGWIQACSHMKFVNTYGKYGTTSWEFPQLVNEKWPMISDSDGKEYPWYGSKTEVATFKGPQPKGTKAVIAMHDHFFPQVTWTIPSRSDSSTPRLTNVTRNQRFFTWLAIKDLKSNQYFILKTIEWGVDLHISVDPAKRIGERAKLHVQKLEEKAVLLRENKHIPPCALHLPNANSAQVLVWRPTDDKPQLVIPSAHKDNSLDMEAYLQDTAFHCYSSEV